MKFKLFGLAVIVCSMVLGATGCVAETGDPDWEEEGEEAESIGTVGSALAPEVNALCLTIDMCGSSGGCGWSTLTWQKMNNYYLANCL